MVPTGIIFSTANKSNEYKNIFMNIDLHTSLSFKLLDINTCRMLSGVIKGYIKDI